MTPEQLSTAIVDVLTTLSDEGAIALPDGVPTAVTVERIVSHGGDLDEARAGKAVTLTLTTETDVTLALRYIWITAGGVDDRAHLPAGGTRLTVLPRAARAR